MKLFTKKQIMSAVKITVLSAILVVGLNYANAAWSGPTANPPSAGVSTPINVSSVNQVKNGSLGVNALSVFGDGLINRDMTATQFCLNGCCISSWSDKSCGVPTGLAPTAPTVTLTANPTSVAYSGNSTLTWSSTNATSCTASGAWSGTKAISNSSGESTGNLTSTQTYTITCTGVGGSTTASATVTVGVPTAPTVTLTANPTSVAYSGNSTLTWSSTNATSCTASGAWSGTKAISNSSGESTGNLTSTQTYTITCTGVGGSTTASATITVAAPACTKQLWYRDADQDGYGDGVLTPDPKHPGSFSQNAVFVCEKPNGYVSNNDDCYDSNEFAHPGQTAYFSTDRGDGSFDYNCYAGEEKRYSTTNIPNDFSNVNEYSLFTLGACTSVQHYSPSVGASVYAVNQSGSCLGQQTGFDGYLRSDLNSCYNINYLSGGPSCGSRFYLCGWSGEQTSYRSYTLNSCQGQSMLYCGLVGKYDNREIQTCK